MKTLVLRLTTALAFSCAPVFADTIAKASVTPVQAELISDLNARLLKVGATVFARVTVDWQSSDCALHRGAILESHVIAVTPHSKTVKGSEVTLAFTRAQCGDAKMGAYGLLLAAMAAPPENSDLGIISDSMPVRTTGTGRGVDLDNMRTSSQFNLQFETPIYQFPLIPNMPMGSVSGIRGLKLSVGTGPERSSVLSAGNGDVALEKHTLLLLIPAQVALSGVPANLSADARGDESRHGSDERVSDRETGAPVTPSPVPAPVPVEDVDRCEPPECNVALPAADVSETMSAASTISIRQLGYSPRPQRALNNFDNDESLAFLGPKELLVAFNPHKLVPRHSLGRSGMTVRLIHAVLVNTETHRVTHAVDWELPDNRQYLWPLADGRVLVHVGSELRVYGAGLSLQNRVSLEGPLAFVRVAPDGSFLAVGVLREKHTPELHAQLKESMDGEPEEDVDILVMNRDFTTIGTSTARSGLMAPTLLNEGQAKLLAMPNMRYRIAMKAWDNQSRTVAHFESSCTPEISSIAPDLLFLVSCSKLSQGREYRVLRMNGKLALKGGSTMNECGHAAAGSANQQAFVVKVVHSNLPVPPGGVFTAEEFASEELGVYRSSDGKRLLGVRVGSPSASRDGYALAPDASQLAVLTRDQVAVYSVPGK